jgi:hypothetical protein
MDLLHPKHVLQHTTSDDFNAEHTKNTEADITKLQIQLNSLSSQMVCQK